jgi:hypothetical protein
MRYIKIYENIFSDLFKGKPSKPSDKLSDKPSDKPKYIKSDYTFYTKATSKIDPTKKVIVGVYMKCPICKTKINDMRHSEIQKCPNCKTEMQTFGNLLSVNDIERDVRYISHMKNPMIDVDYSDYEIKEKLYLADYFKDNKLSCPLCGETLLLPNHDKSVTCFFCNLKITNKHKLECEISKDDLDKYNKLRNTHNDFKKYNL